MIPRRHYLEYFIQRLRPVTSKQQLKAPVAGRRHGQRYWRILIHRLAFIILVVALISREEIVVVVAADRVLFRLPQRSQLGQAV